MHQTIFEGEDDYFFSMNQNQFNSSINDLFFDNFIGTSEEAISGDSPCESQSPPPSYSNIPSIQPNLIFPSIKQEMNGIPQEINIDEEDYQPSKNENKRKRNVAKSEKEKVAKTQAPKKIRKKHPEMQTAVTLSREKLLTTSTEEFNKWVEVLKSQRSLTQEEVQDIRRQKRLIRNRESAQASRDRKKNEFSLLEKQIKQLREEKESALRELHEMRNKVNVLETENLYMKTTIQHNPVLNEIYEKIPSKNVTFVNEKTINKSVKNAGVCLFLLIFSFGLFFNVQNSMTQTQPSPYIPRNIPSANSLPLTHTVGASSLRPMGNNARKLLSTITHNMNTLQSSQAPITVIPLVDEQPQSHLPIIKKEQTNETVIEQKRLDSLPLQPNVHLYCMNAKEYVINPTKDTNELLISLMLPRHSISSTSPIHNHVNNPNDDLIEVTCKVIPQTTK